MKLLCLILLFLISCHNDQNKKQEVSKKEISCNFPSSIESFLIPNCAIQKSDGAMVIAPAILNKIQFNADGLAGGSFMGQGCYWLNKLGVAKKTHCYDNGADYFEENLTRYIDSNGKFGFMNKSLKIVIKPKYDFAFPFKNGFSKVCMGCKSQKSSPDSEHSSMVGGEWSIINISGKIISECAHAQRYEQCQKI